MLTPSSDLLSPINCARAYHTLTDYRMVILKPLAQRSAPTPHSSGVRFSSICTGATWLQALNRWMAGCRKQEEQLSLPLRRCRLACAGPCCVACMPARRCYWASGAATGRRWQGWQRRWLARTSCPRWSPWPRVRGATGMYRYCRRSARHYWLSFGTLATLLASRSHWRGG